MPERLEISQEEISQLAFDKVFQRGEKLYQAGAISQTVWRGAEISACCEGSYPWPYRVKATFADAKIAAAACSCKYDWGGYCKHIVAMLLVYLRAPERFDKSPTLREALLAREKSDLIDIIETMLLEPDLEDIIECASPDELENVLSQLIEYRDFRAEAW